MGAACLDDDKLVDLVEGRLSEAARAELDRHIDDCPTCRALVAAVAPGDVPGPAAARGTAFLRYLILDVVGTGASGIVYAAYDPELDRKVAIKVMRSHHAADAESGKSRLLREAQAIARLVHPNVIGVYDVGSVDDRVFLVIELIDGHNLAAWLREAERGWREIVDVFLQAGRGLAAAHAAGLVHRDFKPENVLIGRDGRVLVTDFGLARSAHDAADAPSTMSPRSLLAAQLTQSGMAAGTPMYMPPEQLRGEATDARSDLFSFCVALYVALYAQHPFAGETLDDITREIAAGAVRLPPPRSRVPPDVHRLLVRGLSARPDDRFASLDPLLTALGRDRRAALRRGLLAAGVVALAGLAVAVPLVVQRQKTQLCRGAEGKLAGVWDETRRAALARAFAATGTPYAADAERATRAALDAYTRNWVGMRVEACEATRVHGEQSEELLDLRVACLDGRRQNLKALVDLLVHADAATVEHAVAAAQALPDLEACRDTAALKSPVRLPSDPAARARIDAAKEKIAKAEALVSAGRYVDGGRAAAAAISAAVATGYRPVEARARYVAGRAAGFNSEGDAAKAHYLAAALAADAGRDDEMAATAWSQLAFLAGNQQAHYDEALMWARLAQARLDRIGGNPRVEALVRVARGVIFSEQGKPELAEPEHRQALALQEQLYGPDDVEVASTLMQLGYDCYARGHMDEALQAWQRSLDIRGRVLGTAHPQYASALCNVGNVYYERHDFDRAIDCYQRALAIEERVFGPEHETLASTLNNLGNIYADTNQSDRAIAVYRRAIAIHERVNPDHPSTASPINNLGDLYLSQGRTEAAREQYRRSLAIVTKATGGDHPWLTSSLIGMGETYLRDGAPAKAVPFLERALAIRQAHAGDPIDLAAARFALGRALADSDRPRARQLVTAARTVFAGAAAAHKSELAEIDAWLTRH